MGRKLQTIYEYFSDYTEQEIDDLIFDLPAENKLIIRSRFGNDLHNPIVQKDWNREKAEKYYGSVLPKIKKKLLNKTSDSISVEQNLETIGATIEEEKIDYSAQLLQLLKTSKTNKEICDTLKISTNQLYNELLKLKNMGMRYTRSYYSDGSIKYKNISTMQALKSYMNVGQGKTIITDINENNMKFLLISDLHFGNELERIDLIDRAYNYCAKNGINIILCGGDLIDGAFTKGKQKISDLYQQIEYFIKNYPQDKNILTFSVAGDHDISAFNMASLDIVEMCNNFRHDIIIGGYNNTEINLKNDKIHLYHHIEAGSIRQTSAPIILHGHSHQYSTEIKNDSLNITLPTLSNIVQPMPSALELDVYFSNGYIANSIVKHLYFGTEDIVLSEAAFDILGKRKVTFGEIKNVESYKQTASNGKVLKKTNHKLSQIEKFNKRLEYKKI